MDLFLSEEPSDTDEYDAPAPAPAPETDSEVNLDYFGDFISKELTDDGSEAAVEDYNPEVTPAPAPERTPEPSPEPSPEEPSPEPEPVPEPVAPEPEATAEPEAEATPEPSPAPTPVPTPEPVPEPVTLEPDATPEPEAELIRDTAAEEEEPQLVVQSLEEETETTNGAGSCSDSKVREMIAADNMERAKLGRNALECHEAASKAAYEWSKEMCRCVYSLFSSVYTSIQSTSPCMSWADLICHAGLSMRCLFR